MRSRAFALAAAIVLVGSLAQSVAGAGARPINASVRVSPISVTLALSPTSIRVGEQITATATVRNLTSTTIKVVQVQLRVDTSGLMLKPAGLQSVQVKAGKTADLKWSICGAVAGTYVVMARATVDGASIDSAGHLVTVVAGGRKRC
jgi:hypothetical protein